MLSDREQKALREVERQLMFEDPELARSFEVAEKSAAQRASRSRRTYTVWIVLTVALSVLTLAAGLPGTALVLATSAGLIALARRHCDNSEWCDTWST